MTTEQSRRDELLERYLAAAPGRPAAPAIRADRSRPLPLSPAQQRVWVLDRLRPGGTEYVVTAAWRLRGPLDVERLRTCWQTIVERHEILRTTYTEREGVPEQLVGEPGVDLTVQDVAAEDVEAVTREAASVPFDLARDRPLRVRVLRQSEDEHVLLLVVHHIAYDGWSTSVVAREISALYGGETLPQLPVQYADFASWQREHAASERVTKQIEFWRRRLDGVVPLTLPTDRPRPPVHDPRGDILRFTVDAELGAAVAALGRAHRATTFMVLLAAYQILLSRYSGQPDVTVGTPLAGRTRAEAQDLIGLFLNTLVLRAEVDGSLSFAEFLDGVRRNTLDAYANQDAPFERLADELAPDRDLSRNPLFQAMLVLQNTADAGFEAAGLYGEQVHSPWHCAKFDLTLELTERPDGSLDGVLEYPVALFDRSTVERVSGHFTELLRGIVANPGAPLADLPWLKAAEKVELARWNDTDVPFETGTLLSLIAEGVIAGGVAVVADGREVSYVELDAWSNQAAHWLRARGVGSESVVGVRLERGVEMVVALVGILKAGAAYLPLDPDYPEDRLRFMVDDSGAGVVIGPGDLTGLDEPASPVDVVVRPENAAYVIYTSGSTGRPKGVVIEHRGIVNRLRWMQDEYGLSPEDRVLQKTPFGFDVSVWEFFWTLSVGATLVMARPGGHRDPEYLADVLVAEGITTAHFVPSMLRAFLAGPVPRLPVRRVLCSGEALPDELAERFHQLIGAELHNLYGPTEASVDVTATRCLPGESVTIGHPIANTRIHLLDGELTIAGVQLARGYLNRPALTAEKFVPNPFAETPGERLYRTGDRARRREDGAFEYLGRFDHQVKIHGNRIELGEVEAALHSHPMIAAAAAAVHDDRLVAYCVYRDGPAPSASELRAQLARTLPEAMLPAVWTSLAALPLTPSGKIDRNALPAPDGARPALAVGYVEPRNATEAAIAEVWADVLGVSPVGVYDPFLELGGRSLAATRICARVSRSTGRRLSVADLFTAPTVAELAELVTAAPLVTHVHSGQNTISAAQHRMWFLDQLSGPSSTYSMYEAYRCTGELDVEALRRALAEVVRRHETLRTTFQSRRGEPELVVSAESEIPLTVVDGSAEEIVDAELDRPFDLARGPLLRCTVIRSAPGRFTLLAVIHHIIADDTSMEIFWRDLAECYAGRASALPELVASSVSPDKSGLEYWKSALAGAPPAIELPDSLPRPARQAQLEGTVKFSVPQHVIAALEIVATEAGATRFMALLAAFVLDLRRTTGRDDLVVGTFAGNRPSVEAEDLIGLFVNTLALRVRVPGDPAYPEVLDAVREAVLGGFRHQDVSFDQVVTALRPPRDLSRNPVAQVAFQSLGSLADRLRLDGVRAEPWRAGQGGNPFDVLVTVREHPDGLAGTLHYDRALFTEAAAKTMADRFVQVVRTVATAPATRGSELPG